jgi:hypothetical protein
MTSEFHPSTTQNDAAPAVGERPSFTTLYEAYLAAFNTHSLADTLSYLSPNIEMVVRSKPMNATRVMIEKAYTDHWAVLTRPIVALEIKEFEEGVHCVLLDEDRGHIIKVVYWYAQEEGEWKHIKHEIVDVEHVKGKAEEKEGTDDVTGSSA